MQNLNSTAPAPTLADLLEGVVDLLVTTVNDLDAHLDAQLETGAVR